MKRTFLLVGLLAAALVMAFAQEAAAAAPTLTGFAPVSGPPAWSVTLTGTGFTNATAVTFTPTDTGYSPQAAPFTVESDTTIVATVPFLAVPPLPATLTVQAPGGPAASVSTFTVDGRLALSEHRGSSGEAVTLTGSGFTGATLVVFGAWRQSVASNAPFTLSHPVKAQFRVLTDTTIVATVPSLRAGKHYWVAVVSPTGKSVSRHSSPFLTVRPTLLKEESSNSFAIRPATVVPSGDGAFLMGKLYKTGRGHAIRWQSWSSSKAHGIGTVWIDNGIPNEAQGTFFGHAGSISASRVRGGRFTRMTIRWEQGGSTHSQALKLVRNGSDWLWQ